MAKFMKTVLLVTVIFGGIWLLVNRKQIQRPEDVVAMARQRLNQGLNGLEWTQPNPLQSLSDGRQTSNRLTYVERLPAPNRTMANSFPNRQSPAIPATSTRQARSSVRVATFAIDGSAGVSWNATELPLLADVCRRYDVINLQLVSSSIGRDQLPQLVNQMNAAEQQSAPGVLPNFQLLARQTSGAASSATSRVMAGRTQLAIIYDANAVQLDNSHWYTTNDPDGVLATPPIVAWFRTLGVPSEQAFTFSLVNVQLDSRRPDRELVYLSELFRAVREDGRGEDDVIIAGNFNAGDRGLDQVQKQAGLTWVVSGTPTNTQRTAQFENIVFNQSATVEFSERSGVFDFMKHYNLRLSKAVELSSHLPVWAEFSLREGDASSKMARRSASDSF